MPPNLINSSAVSSANHYLGKNQKNLQPSPIWRFRLTLLFRRISTNTFTNKWATAGPNLCGGRNDREVVPANNNIRK